MDESFVESTITLHIIQSVSSKFLNHVFNISIGARAVSTIKDGLTKQEIDSYSNIEIPIYY